MANPARHPIWRTIASQLTADINKGHYVIGDRLPTEAELSARFGVNRHTVRRALADMAEQGLVHARRGAGVFVTAQPTQYPIGKRVRFHSNIRATGQVPGKKVLCVVQRAADSREAEALEIEEGSSVTVYDGLSFADGHPIAVFQSVFPDVRLPGMARALAETPSVTQALSACGISDYTRRWTRIMAEGARTDTALHLRLRDDAPVIHTEGLNVATGGMPVEFGRTWFAGDRVTLLLDEDG